MRQVLIDYARKDPRTRKGRRSVDQLDDRLVKDFDDRMAKDQWSNRSRELLRLDEVLTQLAQEDPQRAAIVEYHFFVGLTFAAVAELLGVSKSTVERDWNRTRLQLKRELTGESD
jgi:RNA polymerase sigma factor (sigma-70 family)